MSQREPTTRQTRRRWDRIMLPCAVCASVVAAFLVWLTGHARYAVLPLFVGIVWGAYRFRTPQEGTEAIAIEGNPRVKALLGWLTVMLAGGAALLGIDNLVTGHSLHDPLDTYHWVVFVLYIAVLVTGGALIERQYPSRSRREHASDERE